MKTEYKKIDASCVGEKCGICFREGLETQATHKVGEKIPNQIPSVVDGEYWFNQRHNLTQYICCKHFKYIMGNFAEQICKIEHSCL